MLRKPFDIFRENVEWLEKSENPGMVIPFHKMFDPNLSKSAPCHCCGTVLPPITCHCVSLTVVVLSCPTDPGFYAGQGIAGCTVHVKSGGVDVPGSPFVTTNNLTLKPQIYLSSALSLSITFTYPSGSPFTAPSAFSLFTANCHSYRLEYNSVNLIGGWFCDCCPSTCCDSNGDSVPIYGTLDGDDGIDSGWTFYRDESLSYWRGHPPTNPSVIFTMTCGSSGQLNLTVTYGSDTVTGSATPTSCTPPFSVTFSIDVSATTYLIGVYTSGTLTFTASSSQAFNGAWANTDNGATAGNLCLCPGCGDCQNLYPQLQLTDQKYGGPFAISGGTATNPSASVIGAANCNFPAVLTTFTVPLTYTLSCQSGTPNYLQVGVDYTRCSGSRALASLSSIGVKAPGISASNHINITPTLDCSNSTFTFTMPGGGVDQLICTLLIRTL